MDAPDCNGARCKFSARSRKSFRDCWLCMWERSRRRAWLSTESRWDGDSSPRDSMPAFNLAGGKTLRHRLSLVSLTLLAILSAASAQQNTLQLDPAQTTVKFTLGDVLH